MKRLLLLWVLFTQIACSSVELRVIKKYKGIGEEFKPYIQEFIYASRGKIKPEDFDNFSMGFRKFKPGSDTVGMCHYGAFEVDINAKWWKKTYSQTSKMELVFHELGHCILRRGHTQRPSNGGFSGWLERLGFKIGLFEEKGYLYDGCPASIMHPYILGSMCSNKHFNYYMNELFGRFKRSNYIESRATWIEPEEKKRCNEPLIINNTRNWDEKDESTLIRAGKRCFELYNSCLKIFIKKPEKVYNVVCE